MYLFIIGLLVALGGVGAVENSMTAMQLIQGCVVALVGLALCMAGVDKIKEDYNA